MKKSRCTLPAATASGDHARPSTSRTLSDSVAPGARTPDSTAAAMVRNMPVNHTAGRRDLTGKARACTISGMQLSLPLVSPQNPSWRSLCVSGRVYDVRIARHRRARRYLLRVCADGALRLTVPRGASISDGLKFARRQADWIERERIRQERRAEPWLQGTSVLFRGRLEALRINGREVTLGSERIPLSSDCDVRTAVEAHMACLAARELPLRCLEFAARHGLVV